MPTQLRIATFNLWNLDDREGFFPSLDERIAVMRPQFVRLNADVLCLQEVNAQRHRKGPASLQALDRLLEGTRYAKYHRAFTTFDGTEPYDERNLVILSRFEILEQHQYMHSFASAPSYKKVTAMPEEYEAKEVHWERPILHARIMLKEEITLDVINLHLKSRRPTSIPGHQLGPRTWKSATGWAEGFFISTMKRVGQALETRMLIDHLFDKDPNAFIAVCGDFNSDLEEVPLEAIRGDLENTGNNDLATRVMIPCERGVPEQGRFSLLHNGTGKMLDHILVSRAMLAYFRRIEIHNELLHDQTVLYKVKVFFPESDHAPVIAEFEMPDTKVMWSVPVPNYEKKDTHGGADGQRGQANEVRRSKPSKRRPKKRKSWYKKRR